MPVSVFPPLPANLWWEVHNIYKTHHSVSAVRKRKFFGSESVKTIVCDVHEIQEAAQLVARYINKEFSDNL